MAKSFNDIIQADHALMLNSAEFGVSCYNNRTLLTFDVIKTDAFVVVSDDGIPITEDKPMFNTLATNDIKQNDTLVIENITFRVRDVKKDGIGGIDIYLKD